MRTVCRQDSFLKMGSMEVVGKSGRDVEADGVTMKGALGASSL